MITRIKGNTLSVSVDLEKVEIFENGKKVTDYFPKSDDNVAVRLKGVDVHTFEDIKVIGKTLKWVIDGDLLSCGTYGLEVAIVTADGVKLRSFKENQLKIVNSNDETQIDGDAEFDVENITLETASFSPMIPQSTDGGGGSYDDSEVRRLITNNREEIERLDRDKASSADIPTPSDVVNVVTTYIDAHNSELKGDPGTPGTPGTPGKDGDPGKDGKTPIKGVDYYTSSDKEEFKTYIDNQILGGKW